MFYENFVTCLPVFKFVIILPSISGLDPNTMIDLTEFRNSKRLKQQQYRAENQILLKEASDAQLMVFLSGLRETTNNAYFADWKSRGRTTWFEKKNSSNGSRKRKKDCSFRYSQSFCTCESVGRGGLPGPGVFWMWQLILLCCALLSVIWSK